MKNIKQFAIAAALAVFAAVSAACVSLEANSNDPNSPTNVTKRFVRAAQVRNVGDYKATLSKKSLASVEKDAKEVGMTTDKMLAALLDQNLFGKTDGKEVETRSESINGDRATVEFKDGSGKWMENDLVREDNNWKVSLD